MFIEKQMLRYTFSHNRSCSKDMILKFAVGFLVCDSSRIETYIDDICFHFWYSQYLMHLKQFPGACRSCYTLSPGISKVLKQLEKNKAN